MSAQEVWGGLGDSNFLSAIKDREREPGRLLVTLVGGAILGLLASVCGLLLVMVLYAILIGDGPRGLEGLFSVIKQLGDPQAVSPLLTVFRLVVATAVDGVFLLVLVAASAVVYRQSFWVYVSCAGKVRWRLLGVGMALSAAAMAPIAIAERLLNADGAGLPFLSVSPLPIDRAVYCLSALLLIPAAAAEELFFRGWLLRQVSILLRRPLPLVAVTSLLFSFAHLDFNPDAFLTRALMGAGFAYMTLRLGGIEFSTGAHAVNNMMIVLFLQPLSLQQAQGADISAFSLFEDLALIGGYIMITELVARLPTLRRWAGVRLEDVSPAHHVSAHFS